MLNLIKGTEATIYFTATENATITAPRFLFVFVHRGTNEKIVVNLENDNDSNRIDSAVVPSATFENSTPGMWQYTVRQKSDSTTTETGAILELGYMNLSDSTAFTMTEYTEQDNTFTVYEQ